MRRLWIPVLLLAFMIGTAAFNVTALDRFTQDLIDRLEHAQSMAAAGDGDGARSLTAQAEEQFHSRSLCLHVTLSHADLDEIEVLFREVLAQLEDEELYSAYAAANAQLIARLRLLSQDERPVWENIF